MLCISELTVKRKKIRVLTSRFIHVKAEVICYNRHCAQNIRYNILIAIILSYINNCTVPVSLFL